nr:MAG TPA: hypothetical protein [Caudoviricetes sp.]
MSFSCCHLLSTFLVYNSLIVMSTVKLLFFVFFLLFLLVKPLFSLV